MFWIILIILVVVALIIYFKFFKMPKLNTINFIDGEPGTGKTSLCVYLAMRSVKREVFWYRIKNSLRKMFHKEPLERPLLYSNILLKKTPFVVVDKDLLTRQKHRCSVNSCMVLDEVSLVADQNVTGKSNALVCEQMRDMWKLCRHEGFKRIFVNSQNISSVNYTLKDCIGSYLWIHSRRKLPFFSLLRVKELAFSRENNIINNFDKDSEEGLKLMLVPNRIFKKYDSRCYSVFTDMLPVYDNEIVINKKASLKQKELVSFMPLNELYKNLRIEESKVVVEEKKEEGVTIG